MKIICFLTVRPCKVFYDFCKTLQNKHYKVFICVDDILHEIPDYDNDIPIIRVQDELCIKEGFCNSITYTYPQLVVCARDRALYFFTKKYKRKFDNIWFIEQDVFIPTSKTIQNIDKKFPNFDLLSAQNTLFYEHQKYTKMQGWYWGHIFANKIIDFPFGKSMISIIRVSEYLLKIIADFVDTHKTMLVDEVFFNTLALQNKCTTYSPQELSRTVVYKRSWKLRDLNIHSVYHPIKCIEQQTYFRKKLNENIFKSSNTYITCAFNILSNLKVQHTHSL